MAVIIILLLVVGIIVLLMKSRRPVVQRTLYDEIVDKTGALFRSMCEERGVSVSHLSNSEINAIASEVMIAFRKVSEEIGESIPAESLLKIAFKFIVVYVISGPDFYEKHLMYELNKYIRDGLRDDYR